MKLIKPLRPTMREKKRYLAFEILAEKAVPGQDAFKAIIKALQQFLGDYGMAGAGIIILKDKYKKNKGLLRVNHRFVDHARAALAIITEIEKTSVVVRSIGTSGILKKAETKYLL